jgi:hypothetical protein
MEAVVPEPTPAETKKPAPTPTWKCEYCGQFYSERTGSKHGYCQQAQDRKDAESVWRDV